MSIEATTELPSSNNSLTAAPVELISDEEYAALVVRDLPMQWPTKVYDNGQFPTRELTFWPTPTQNNFVELWLWEALTNDADLDAELTFPPGYERYLKYKLAVELAPEFGKEPSPELKYLLKQAETAVKALNQKIPVTAVSRHTIK